jgi:Fur family zinc uptake transcriptional regulator
MASKSPAKLSRNAALVHDFLCRHEAPASAYQILDGLRSDGISAPPTVYRALDQLVGRGLAHRVESLNAFVACSHPRHADGNAFAICQDCGGLEEILDDEVSAALETLADRRGFAIAHAAIELTVTCADCRGEHQS